MRRSSGSDYLYGLAENGSDQDFSVLILETLK